MSESKKLRITPDTLRFFSSEVDEIVTLTHCVESTYRTNARSRVQYEELRGQATKIDEIHGERQDCMHACMRETRHSATTRRSGPTSQEGCASMCSVGKCGETPLKPRVPAVTLFLPLSVGCDVP